MTFLITAGPTREPIDPVRYISNRSSGKMGYAIAEAALDVGHDVILISGPVNLAPPRNAKVISVSTSDEMFDAVHQHADELGRLCTLRRCGGLQAGSSLAGKNQKTRRSTFARINSHARHSPFVRPADRIANFFSLDSPPKRITSKQTPRKNCAKRIAISSSRTMRASRMETDENELLILFRDGETKKISRAPKTFLARELVKIFLNSQQKSLTKKM